VEEYHGIERRLREPSNRWDLDNVDLEDWATDRSLSESAAYSYPDFSGTLFSQKAGQDSSEGLREELETLLDRFSKLLI